MRTLLREVNLVQDNQITPCNIIIKDNLIEGIGAYEADIEADLIIEGQNNYLSHGFIDIHTHGGGGYDFMDGTPESFLGAAMIHAKHGTTAMVPTTLASTKEELVRSLQVFETAKKKSVGAKLVGFHIEGPYLSIAQCGAQDIKYIRNPKFEEYSEIVAASDHILRWTIAPELEGTLELGEYLQRQGILPSIGHSNATYEEVLKAIASGYNHLTHFYSCMSTITRKDGYRIAGIIESGFLCKELSIEIIADGSHVPAPLLQMVYRFIGPDRIALVTDSMRGAGMPEGESILGSLANGQKVIIEDGVAKMPDKKAFGGSVATTDRLVRNMMQLAGASLQDAIKMMTVTPAKIIGKSNELGVVLPGRSADLLLFNQDIDILMTMVDGKIIYKKQ
jgi:N-acetylglucosamine-6-phosphate deacetylase